MDVVIICLVFWLVFGRAITKKVRKEMEVREFRRSLDLRDRLVSIIFEDDRHE